ncbi:unnamed protein product [Ostreobium quekettii]|uniref:Pterin-binding domain-containing protein n=1 Tax=Ostreobium quekettii TaxID=121088 RepID=A0A8S1IWH6_9CHLO|nr:unnamed protein product [Ostreobium quekettii]|eukprot:evm.model.scf_102.10 EVM.evm.TU.scf_102.10   scf_102:132986-140120(+)
MLWLTARAVVRPLSSPRLLNCLSMPHCHTPRNFGSETEVVIALGSNLGNRVQNLTEALRLLEGARVKVLGHSCLYESAPVHLEDQPFFLNAAVLAKTSLSPTVLLDLVKSIELDLGRDLSNNAMRWGPRPVDLDIIFYGSKRVHTERLAIPHERWHIRDFVKAPLANLAGLQCCEGTDVQSMLAEASRLWQEEGGEALIGSRQLRRVMPFGNELLEFGKCTKVMGILNVTPDSFSDGGLFNTVDLALAQARCMVEEGADMIDIGGQSTRPRADRVPAEQEVERVVPIIKALREEPKLQNILISIDTFYGEVAKEGVRAGAHIVNDVSAGKLDRTMFRQVAELNVPYVMMHMRGNPQTMQQEENTTYRDICKEVGEELQCSVEAAMSTGVLGWNVILDPGIGFSKTHAGNVQLIRGLKRIWHEGLSGTCQQMPRLLGVSRKGFIGTITEKKDARQRDVASAAAAVACVAGGADIIRAHNAGFTRDAAIMADAIYRKK